MASSTSSSASKPSTKPEQKKLLSLDSASLVDLKAEVFRKTKEAKFNQRHGGRNRSEAGQQQQLDEKKKDKWVAKKTHEERRIEKLNLKTAASAAYADREEREKDDERRRIMQKKADLYQRYREGRSSDGDGGSGDRFLVNFRDRSGDEREREAERPAAPGEEWVEYEDALGRSRRCMKKDLPDLVKNDKELYKYKEEEARARESEKRAEEADLMSEDMRRELLRQKWEKEEEDNLNKRSVHYQDVLFDEARTHGAGYYRFSRDEAQRAAEKEELDTMHEETLKARKEADRSKAKRKAALAERLKKVRERKRVRMGLPLKEEEEKDVKAEDENDSEEEKHDERSILEGLKAMRRLEEEERKKRAPVREWDKGKEGVEKSSTTGRHFYDYVLKGEKNVLSQKEWVDKKREERPNEFAPPTAYAKDEIKKQNKKAEAEKKPAQNKKTESPTAGPSPAGPPTRMDPSAAYGNFYPGAFGYYPPPPGPHGFGPYPYYSGMPYPGPPPPSTASTGGDPKEVQSSEPTAGPSQDNMTLTERLKMHREFASKPIVNEVEVGSADSHQQEVEDRDDDGREEGRRRAEVAPPCSMDYFSSSGYKKGFEYRKGFKTHEEMADSVSAGLKKASSARKESESAEDSD